MKPLSPSPFFIPAALVFWGWQTGLWIISMLLIPVLSSHTVIEQRWEFSSKDFSHISDLCTLLFIGSIIYLYFSMGTIYVIFKFIQWLPALFWPLLLAQHYSISNRIDLRAISFFFRSRKEYNRTSAPAYPVDFDYPFALLCIISGGFGNQRDMGFYIGLLVLSAFGLWKNRPGQRSLMPWTFLLTCAALIGFWGHTGLHGLHKYLEAKGMDWFYDVAIENDPYRSITGLGYIGDLKPSNRILFRGKFPAGGTRLPLLLREAAYNRYKASKWFAIAAAFEPKTIQGDTLQLGPADTPGESTGETGRITLLTPLRKGAGLLKLPTGVHRITGLYQTGIEQNRFGAVKVKDGPGLLAYSAVFGKNTPIDSPPREKDLSIPQEERAAVDSLVRSLGLKHLPPWQALRKLSDYFEANYTYSLTLNPRFDSTPLADFLKRTHSGHCEYFATATVLILRAAGIPARYATGYSVHEWSPWEDAYVVRRRHAHAWAIVFTDNVWQDVDNTPSRWRIEEEENAPFHQFFTDVGAWLKHRFLEWRFDLKNGNLLLYLVAGIGLLGLMISRKLLVKRRKTKSVKKKKTLAARPEPPGKDSPFYAIEKGIAEKRIARLPGETFKQWIERLEARPDMPPASIAELRLLLAWHYRLRFDPRGLSDGEKQMFKERAGQWLYKYGAVESITRKTAGKE